MSNPYMIDWAITNKCDLNCLHCRGIDKPELDSRTILKIAEEIPLLKPGWVIIEGGEPLLRKDLFEIIEIIFRSKIRIYLISNGMVLDEDIARRLAEFNVNLMISMDGSDRESYERIRKGASFKRLKESIAIAKKYGILDSCPVTIGKHNYQQTYKLFEFVKNTGYKKITFLGLKPCMDYERYVLNAEEYEEFLLSVIKYQKEYGIDVYVDEPFFKPFLKRHNVDYSANSQDGIIFTDVSRCIFGEYMFIEINGDVKPCTFAPVVIGNVSKKGLNEIWNDMQNSELVKKIKDFSTRENFCSGCEYLYECGGCRSRTFNLTGSWTESDPSCPLQLIRKELSNIRYCEK